MVISKIQRQQKMDGATFKYKTERQQTILNGYSFTVYLLIEI